MLGCHYTRRQSGTAGVTRGQSGGNNPQPMPYRICKTLEIENGHMLSLHPDKCQFPHGHTRKVEFVLEAADLNASGMVCDFKIIKQAVGEYLDTFDHAMCMNTADKMYPVFKEA